MSSADRPKSSLQDAMDLAAVLPTRLDRAPYRHVIWDPEGRRMMVRNKTLARRLAFHMLDLAGDEDRLRADHAAA